MRRLALLGAALLSGCFLAPSTDEAAADTYGRIDSRPHVVRPISPAAFDSANGVACYTTHRDVYRIGAMSCVKVKP